MANALLIFAACFALVGHSIVVFGASYGNSADSGGKSTQKKAVNAINKGKGPEIKNGSNRLKFPKNINYEVDVEGEILVVEAEQLPRPHSMKAVSNGFKEKAFEFTDSELYMDSEGHAFAVTAEVDSNGHVKSKLSGRVRKGKTMTWINGEKALSWDIRERNGTDVVITEIIDEYGNSAPSVVRKKRDIPTVYDYSTGNTVELAYLVDTRWMRSFRLWNANEEDAVAEAALYLTVLTTEMNYIYRSVKIRSEEDSSITDIEIVVYGVAMLYPQVNEEFNFIADAVLQQDYLNAFGGSCTTQSCPYARPGFHQWIQRNMNLIPFQWDHFAYITGYDLYSPDTGTGLLGVTSADSICESDSFKYHSSSITEDLHLDALPTLAHELGHSIGSDHDGTTSTNQCATTGFIMSQYAISPTLAMQDTFYTFSSCSVEQFLTHLNNMKAQGRDCLAETSGTETDFRNAFCSGSRGDVYDVDYQCSHHDQLTVQSQACDLETNINGEQMVPAEACILEDIVTCTAGGADTTCNRQLSNVNAGTPCDGPNSNTTAYVCFNGRCVEETELCAGWNTTDTIDPVEFSPCDCTGLRKKDANTCCANERNEDNSCCLGCREHRNRCKASR